MTSNLIAAIFSTIAKRTNQIIFNEIRPFCSFRYYFFFVQVILVIKKKHLNYKK